MNSYWSKIEDKLGLATDNRKLKTDKRKRSQSHRPAYSLLCKLEGGIRDFFHEVDSYTKVLGIRIP